MHLFSAQYFLREALHLYTITHPSHKGSPFFAGLFSLRALPYVPAGWSKLLAEELAAHPLDGC